MLADICAATDLVAAKSLERNPTPRHKDGRGFLAVQNRSRFKTTRLINKRFCSTSQTNLFGRTTADPIKP
jgi:hypothetical protein